jgi:hypothetical protein
VVYFYAGKEVNAPNFFLQREFCSCQALGVDKIYEQLMRKNTYLSGTDPNT